MGFLAVIAILLALAAVYCCLNEATFQWESSIGLTFFTLMTAIVLGGARFVEWPVAESAVDFVSQIDFSQTFLHGMLCFLLFAGALDVPIKGLEREKWIIAALALIATLVATLVTGTIAWLGGTGGGVGVVRVGGMRSDHRGESGAGRTRRTCEMGSRISRGGGGEKPGVSLAAVTGTFAVGEYVEVSAPIATVILGLIVGNFSLKRTGEESQHASLNAFWQSADAVLNAVLFVLVGLQALLVNLTPPSLLAGLLAIPCVLAGRWLSVLVPIAGARVERRFDATRWKLINLLTWSGLRGGLSVALVMSLPESIAERELLLTMTYGAVVFSIIVQGLTISKFFPPDALKEIAKEV